MEENAAKVCATYITPADSAYGISNAAGTETLTVIQVGIGYAGGAMKNAPAQVGATLPDIPFSMAINESIPLTISLLEPALPDGVITASLGAGNTVGFYLDGVPFSSWPTHQWNIGTQGLPPTVYANAGSATGTTYFSVTYQKGSDSYTRTGKFEVLPTSPISQGQSIQAAIDGAPSSGRAIVVGPGIYYENIDFKGKKIHLKSTQPYDPVTVTATIIDGGGSGSVVTFSGTETAESSLQGFTITNGSGTLSVNSLTYGGGIAGFGCRATIRNNIIIGNTANVGGGIDYCGGTIAGNTIKNNIAIAHRTPYEEDDEGGYGGGLTWCFGTVSGNNIIENESEEDGGGLSMCAAYVSRNTIESNHAGWCGGGVSYCVGMFAENRILNNTAVDDGGGMAKCFSTTVRSNLIQYNSAGTCGGGISNTFGYIDNNVIACNSTIGGVPGNIGGGLAWCNAVMRHNTIYGNSAEIGGGLYLCDSTVSDFDENPDTNYYTIIQNSVIWGNSSESGPDQLDWCEIPSYSCIQNWSQGGTGNTSADPKLMFPGNSDFRLEAGSSCIDSATPVDELSRDWRGNARPYNGIPDIGAAEYRGEITPARVTGLTATPDDDYLVKIDLSWSANVPAPTGYNIYYAHHPDGPYTKWNPTPLSSTAVSITDIPPGPRYYWVVTAVVNPESGQTPPIDATPLRWIVIDPGHGGEDAGASGIPSSLFGDNIIPMKEKELTHALALGMPALVSVKNSEPTCHLGVFAYIANHITSNPGDRIGVWFTRFNQEEPKFDLEKRPLVARLFVASAFLSIHFDGLATSPPDRMTTMVYRLDSSGDYGQDGYIIIPEGKQYYADNPDSYPNDWGAYDQYNQKSDIDLAKTVFDAAFPPYRAADSEVEIGGTNGVKSEFLVNEGHYRFLRDRLLFRKWQEDDATWTFVASKLKAYFPHLFPDPEPSVDEVMLSFLPNGLPYYPACLLEFNFIANEDFHNTWNINAATCIPLRESVARAIADALINAVKARDY